MNERERAAIHYLTPPVYSFWSITDDGETFVWRDGKTIAFRAELETVFRRLGKQPLPPFTAVLLLSAATRDAWDETSSEKDIVSGLLQSLSAFKTTVLWANSTVELDTSPDWSMELFSGLDNVHSLSAELRHTPQAKAEIVALVSENTKYVDRTTQAEHVLAILDKRLHGAIEVSARTELDYVLAPIAIGSSTTARDSLRSLLDGLKCLRDGLRNLDAERLRLRRDTGLDELPSPAPPNLSPAEQTRALMRQLDGDPELSGVVRLARNLMAAVHLPKAIAEEVEMPLGGVSDISNRGSLDRLLLSELVHDDLTLAVRVAMNEALYLRRESPPSSPPRERLVFLDAGLRMWGVPRVFATAVALALAATSDAGVAAQIYRADEEAVKTVDLNSRAGLVEHLGALATTAHPGNALPALLKEIEAAATTDTLVVTSPDTLADPDFIRALNALELPAFHLVTVDRNGAFRLLLVTRRGRKLVREARFVLDDLLTPAKRSQLIVDRSEFGKPAILSVQPFPLLLSHHFEIRRAWSVQGNGALTITRDGLLLHWKAADRGGKQLADNLPPGNLHWAASEVDRDGIVRAVVGRLSRRRLVLLQIDLAQGTCVSHGLSLDADSPRGVTAYQGAIIVIFDDHVEAFDGTTGDMCGRMRTGDLNWVEGRFFARGKFPNVVWHALAFDGVSPRLERLTTNLPVGSVVKLFDCRGADGPMCITARGHIQPYSGSAASHSTEFSFLAISRDGTQVALCITQSPYRTVLINVVDGDQSPVMGDPREAVEPDLKKVFARPVRRRFRTIAGLSDGTLALSTSRGGWWRLTLDEKSGSLYLLLTQSDFSEGERLFKSVPSGSEAGYSLQAATWRDGSTAFLDSRGLLHLWSSDDSIPQATIVLVDDQMAGWVADGKCWGDPYFLAGNGPRRSDREFYEQVVKPFVSRLQC